MSKLEYKFNALESALQEALRNCSKMEDLFTILSSLNINIDELTSDLENAKKSIQQNIDIISDDYSMLINRAKSVCDDHKAFENSMFSQNILSSSTSGNYTIKRGDTLSKIATLNNITVSDLVKANNIKNPDLILVGQSIIIPRSNTASYTNSSKVSSVTPRTAENTSVASSASAREKSANSNQKDKTSTSTDSSKYNNKKSSGFEVTTNNKTYSLSDSEKELLTAIVAAECDKSLDDALAVVSVILNRCEDSSWSREYGANPIKQATARNQFVVYQEGLYKKYMNYNVDNNVKKAVADALSGVRNNRYLSFRSNASTRYSQNMITNTGNRYK